MSSKLIKIKNTTQSFVHKEDPIIFHVIKTGYQNNYIVITEYGDGTPPQMDWDLTRKQVELRYKITLTED